MTQALKRLSNNYGSARASFSTTAAANSAEKADIGLSFGN